MQRNTIQKDKRTGFDSLLTDQQSLLFNLCDQLLKSGIVFDDSTAAVDMRTEFLIQEALRNLMQGRTTFVIAQRLRTVMEADQILVMRDGEIVEQGKHEELLEAGGFYRQIYDLELREQEEVAAAALAAAG